MRGPKGPWPFQNGTSIIVEHNAISAGTMPGDCAAPSQPPNGGVSEPAAALPLPAFLDLFLHGCQVAIDGLRPQLAGCLQAYVFARFSPLGSDTPSGAFQGPFPPHRGAPMLASLTHSLLSFVSSYDENSKAKWERFLADKTGGSGGELVQPQHLHSDRWYRDHRCVLHVLEELQVWLCFVRTYNSRGQCRCSRSTCTATVGIATTGAFDSS